MSFKLVIEGFKTKAQAETFIKWYEGQGEQDASVWFGDRMSEEIIDVNFMPVDCCKTYPIKWDGDTVRMILKISEKSS